ncbi:MAG TPA: helix-turn-helix transcriptional regulator [Conexibacter sp.]|nr:helix-turn-helix transcriptional regulator [Conexibacter sp.]
MQDKRTRRPAKSPDHDALGLAVRKVRAGHGVSQEELGFRSQLHRNYIGSIERGEINPTFRILLNLSRGLEVRLSTLMWFYERNLRERGR